MAKDKTRDGADRNLRRPSRHQAAQSAAQGAAPRRPERDLDDPVARAEKALAGLSGEFKNWMAIEADRLSAAHAAILRDGFTDVTPRRAVSRRPRHQGRRRHVRISLRRRRRRKPVPDHRARARSRRGALQPDRASHQCHPGHRARAHQARHRRHGRRIEQAIARHRRRIISPMPIATVPNISKRCWPRASRRRSKDVANCVRVRKRRSCAVPAITQFRCLRQTLVVGHACASHRPYDFAG